jgi:predicted ATPase/class 3 adenylate cyclase
MTQQPTGTVTFLFTDIEGSTKLAQAYPDIWESLQKRHHAILRSAIEAHAGYVFQIIGDAFCASFHTAGDGLRAAVKAQIDLKAEDWGETPIKVRMGIHTGKAVLQESADYSGYAALSRVQRLMSAGHGGQTIISQATQELVRDELPQGITLRDMGTHRLKDLIHPEHIYQIDIPNLPIEFPALKTLDIQLNNLPAQMTAFVGRDREIAALLGLLRNPDVRLVTLTGAGGTGKTRLSLQVAADLLDEYEHGVWFVELASITDPELVLPTLASALKVKESAKASIEQTLHEYLHERQLLLVIDNFEQVVSAAPVISKLLAAAPKVKVLISSREVLHLRGEHDYPVPPLGLPESKRKQTAAVFAQYEAIALFIQHAQAASPAFELNEENASIVAEICTRLDGLPLAIELAAARSRLLKPIVMLEKLKSRLNVLTGGARDMPQRQQTIRGAIDWSYELLDEAEKILFARLGVFIGGWTVESAEAVCRAGLSIDVLSGLESLLDKSLLRQMNDTRFTMLETIREYAFEKLTQSGELLSIQQAQANDMDALLVKAADAASGPEEVKWFAALDDEFDNLRSVMEWAMTHQQPSLIFKAGRLWAYWLQRVIVREPLDWLERGLALEFDGSPIERARAFTTAGNLASNLGDQQRHKECYESALVLYREANDVKGISTCLNGLGSDAKAEKDFEKARQLYEQSLAANPTPNAWGAAMTLYNLGNLAKIRGDWQGSKDYYLRALEICERLGAEAGISYAQGFLGMLAIMRRELDEAKTHFESYLKASWVQANPIWGRVMGGFLGYVHLLMGNKLDAQRLLNHSLESAVEYAHQSSNFSDSHFILEGKARLELMDGRAERAAQLFGAAWAGREKDDYPLTEFERPDYEAAIAEARSAIGDAAFDDAFAKGQAMTIEQTIIFALEESNE